MLYNSLIRSHLEFGILAWGGVNQAKLNKLLNIQKKAVRNISGRSMLSHSDPLFRSLQILKINDLYKFNSSIFMFKYLSNQLPESFNNMLVPFNAPNRTLSYKIPRSRTNHLKQFPLPSLPRTWNLQPLDIKQSTSLNIFKTKLLFSMIDAYPAQVRCNRANCRDCR